MMPGLLGKGFILFEKNHLISDGKTVGHTIANGETVGHTISNGETVRHTITSGKTAGHNQKMRDMSCHFSSLRASAAQPWNWDT